MGSGKRGVFFSLILVSSVKVDSMISVSPRTLVALCPVGMNLS
jgi:hypothetical protein